MKTTYLSLLLVVPGSLAYYSEGWKPGQPATKYLTSTTSASGAIPTAPAAPVEPPKPWSIKDLKFGLEDILTSESVSRVLGRFGVNITERLAAAREGIPARFNLDIPLITDDNYEDLILNEKFSSEEEEKDRVWALLVTIGAQDPVSTFYDQIFDGAHNLTVKAGDMSNVRWGRIDYIDVTDITTRWVIWKAPVLVIAKDRGQTLRFFKTKALGKLRNPSQMRDFIRKEDWEATAPWSGPWSPRGNRAPYLNQFAKFSTVAYGYLAIAPRWLLLLITGGIASAVMSFLHRDDDHGPADAVPDWAKGNAESSETTSATPATATAATAKTTSTDVPSTSASSPAKKRKGKKA